MSIAIFRKTPEYRLDKCTFSHPILTDDTDPLSGRETDIAYIEEGLTPTDKCIFDLDEILWCFLFRSLEDELYLILSFWFFYDLDFLEHLLSAFRESCTRSCSEAVYERLLTLYHRLLLVIVFLGYLPLMHLLLY